MPRYAQLVMGPAGCGKSTYCNTMKKHCETLRRTVHIVNLDPAAENFDYTPLADIRDLISIDDVMDAEDLQFGPNGGLVFCMEYLAENFQWLQDSLDEEEEDDYIIFDCPENTFMIFFTYIFPCKHGLVGVGLLLSKFQLVTLCVNGQIELYTHNKVISQIVQHLVDMNFRVCGVFLIDAQFLLDSSKFVSGLMAALSAMVMLEIPHINIMSKLDLLNSKSRKHIERFLDPEMDVLLAEELNNCPVNSRYEKLNHAIAGLIDSYTLVHFLPLDIKDEETINDVLTQVDMTIQYGEDVEPKEPRDELNDSPEEDTHDPADDFFN